MEQSTLKWWHLENFGPIYEYLELDPPYYGPYDTYEEAFEEWKKLVGWEQFTDEPQLAEEFRQKYPNGVCL